MSFTENVPVPCPDCGVVSKVTIWASANVTLDPQAKTELLEGRLNTFTCPCGEKHVLPVTFMYHDMDRGYAIVLTYRDEPADLAGLIATLQAARFPGYRLRVVTSRNELVEKIHAFDDGVDDRILEIVKIIVMKAVLERSKEEVREIRYTPIRQTEDRLMRFWLMLKEKARPILHTISRETLYDQLMVAGQRHLSKPGVGRHEWMVVDTLYGLRLGKDIGAFTEAD